MMKVKGLRITKASQVGLSELRMAQRELNIWKAKFQKVDNSVQYAEAEGNLIYLKRLVDGLEMALGAALEYEKRR